MIRIIESHIITQFDRGSLSTTSTPSRTTTTDPTTIPATDGDEANIQPSLPSDFYGEYIRLCLIGYLRPEQKFTSLDTLKTQIQLDIDTTRCLSEATLTSLPSPSSHTSSSISNIDLLTCLQEGLYIAKKYFLLPYDMNSLLSHSTTATSTITSSSTNTVNNSDDSDSISNSNVYSNCIARLLLDSESYGTGIDKKAAAKTIFWSRVINKATAKIKET